MKRNFSGFTLVEVIVVILLLGIISAMAIPAMNSTLDEMKVDGAAQEVIYAIQYTQSRAIKEGLVYGVEFSPSTESFRCYDEGTNTIRNPLDKNPYVLDFTAQGHLQGVNLVSTSLPGQKAEFNPLGEISGSGTIVLGYADFQKTITVSVPIGKITVQ